MRVENDCQNCGFTQVRINGLDGHYSQILMNSRPVFSALAGVYGLEQIPANMIDRVEVMRGGGSALFGSSAIGGTINIITKDPTDNSAAVSHTLTSIGVTGALDNNTTVNASVVHPEGRLGLFVYGQNRVRDGYDHDGDGYTEIARLEGQTLGLRGFVKPTELSRLTLEYHGTHEYRRGGDNIELPPHEAMVAEETRHRINAVDLGYNLTSPTASDRLSAYAAMQHTARRSYYGSEKDPDAYGRTTDLVALAGAQWTHSFRRLWFMPAELVAGAEFNYNYLHDATVGYDHDARQHVRIYSAYAQNEWRDRPLGLPARRAYRQAFHGQRRHSVAARQHTLQPHAHAQLPPVLLHRLPLAPGLRRGFPRGHRGRRARGHGACSRPAPRKQPECQRLRRLVQPYRRRADQRTLRGLLHRS